MRVVNSNFSFTVKVGADHFGGQFQYARNGAETVKISFRRLPQKRGNGYAYEQTNHLKKVNGRWVLWDLNRSAPKYNSEHDRATYAVFREAYGLSLLDER
jgi:hypothetical protein